MREDKAGAGESSVSLATVMDRPPRTSPPPVLVSRSSAGTATTTVASPLEALARDEVLRTRNFCFMGFGISAVGVVAIPFLPGGYYETRVLLSFIVVEVLWLVYLLYRCRDPATFHRGRGVSICWFLASAAVNAAVPYFGPYSPVPILPLIGIYFVGLGQSRTLAYALYGLCVTSQAVSGALVIAGVADPGIVRADYLSVPVQIVLQLLVQLIFAAAFYISRASRRASLAALTELQEASRALAQREALLEEARDELRRALGSGRGRFSDQLIGHYRLGDVIGRGAMGEVYEGVDTRKDQRVAVKMLAHTSLGNPMHVQRFLRELKTAVAFESPNVVRVIEVGEEPLPHLVMERLDGRDLSAILREKRVLPGPMVIDLLQQLGAGITAAGAAGVIHRDLKPQNVFLADTTWKILDFGVSRLNDASDSLTAGHVVGTPAYMAPEQARGASVDHRTDLYSLAAIAYRCLTGHAPVASGDIVDMLYRVVHTSPRRPSALAQLPEDLDAVLAIGLAKEPADRFATASELVAAVAAALDHELPEATRSRGRALLDRA